MSRARPGRGSEAARANEKSARPGRSSVQRSKRSARSRKAHGLLIAMMMTIVATACLHSDVASHPPLVECRSAREGIVKTVFNGSPAGGSAAPRHGWNDREPGLSPERVGRPGGMVSKWTSPPFESVVRQGTTYIGRTYASPLYADGVRIARGPGTGLSLSVVFVATSNGDVYALSAADASCAGGETLGAGSILWQTRIVNADIAPSLDGHVKEPGTIYPGMAIGTLATPVLDLAAGTLYVTAMDSPTGDAGGIGSTATLPVWKAFAIDIATGDVRPGWPVTLGRDAIEPVNTNGPAYFDEDARYVSQRSALALSPEGDRMYVAFGGYYDLAIGWLVAIDTKTARIVASFSGAPDPVLVNGERSRHANAGMWAPGGPAIDELGRLYVTTGNSPPGAPSTLQHAWGNSMLRLSRDLKLESAYSPHDYCTLDYRDIDISGSSVALLPTLDGAKTSRLAAFGGKAGVVYLLDRDALPPAGDARAPCATQWEGAALDVSLLPTEPGEPYCDGFAVAGRDEDPCIEPRPSTRCVRGPLQVFGPGSDLANLDNAKMRSTPAYFRGEDGTSFLYVSGTTKEKRCDVKIKPPSLVRLRVSATADAPASLVRDGADEELRFLNPGSPVVSSDGGRNPIVWVIDQNALRSHPLLDPTTPPPTLYAVDGRTMKRLWQTSATDLEPGGKYITPIIAHGEVYVATDRLHAFAPAPP